MSMLAERKRREKWCINPRGKAWSEDQTKFGQRILEKMGWSAGQGLGINNQGPTEIVAVRKKDDNTGLGYKENGEEWLKTTSDFNELLDQLGSSMEEEGEQAVSNSSLEDRSKQSKARVHYHKFTRSKDLSRYSQKDLASIIGPVVIKAKCGNEMDPDYTSNQINRGSSDEYFNSKKLLRENELEKCENYEYTLDEENDTKSKKRKRIKNEHNHSGDHHTSTSLEVLSGQSRIYNDEENHETNLNESTNVFEDIRKVSKKKKKKFQVQTEKKESELDSENLEHNGKEVKKKVKKNKEKILPEESSSVEYQEELCEKNKCKSKNRKVPKNELDDSHLLGCSEDVEVNTTKYYNAQDDEISSKKKKKKLKKEKTIYYCNEADLSSVENNTKESKKRKSKNKLN